MIKISSLFCIVLILTFAVSCGGGGSGGGGSGIAVTGKILSVSTGEGPDPPAVVTIGGASTQTEPGTGEFLLFVEPGATTMLVTSDFPPFTFNFPAITQSTDLGEFWIGPQTVTVQGSTVDVNTTEPIPDVTVKFAGRIDSTDENGEFTLTEVAYDAENSWVFESIVGRAEKEGYIPSNFTANQNPINGVITLPPILMAPSNDENPPPPPYNLWGNVTTSDGGSPNGVEVTLELTNGTPIRFTTVGEDNRYYFWVAPNDYIIFFHDPNGIYRDENVPVTGFTSPDQIVQIDVQLDKKP
ncbi:MAG TPA: hypothetical protein VNK96_04470 [Fimbriimonadales bacterium]|nr:hypothetical protein [Fimbriimonadales bacterium]